MLPIGASFLDFIDSLKKIMKVDPKTQGLGHLEKALHVSGDDIFLLNF